MYVAKNTKIKVSDPCHKTVDKEGRYSFYANLLRFLKNAMTKNKKAGLAIGNVKTNMFSVGCFKLMEIYNILELHLHQIPETPA